MGAVEGCASCCFVYSSVGVVLLLLFGVMFQRKAMTFAIMSAKMGWDPEEKARACFTAAVLYGATLFISVLTKIYVAKSKASADFSKLSESSPRSGVARRGIN